MCWGGHWAEQKYRKLFSEWLLPLWACFLPLNACLQFCTENGRSGGNLVASCFNDLIVHDSTHAIQDPSFSPPPTLDFVKTLFFSEYTPHIRSWTREQTNNYVKIKTLSSWISWLTLEMDFMCVCVWFLFSFFLISNNHFVLYVSSQTFGHPLKVFWWILACVAVCPRRKTRVSNEKINFPICCFFHFSVSTAMVWPK